MAEGNTLHREKKRWLGRTSARGFSSGERAAAASSCGGTGTGSEVTHGQAAGPRDAEALSTALRHGYAMDAPHSQRSREWGSSAAT